MFEVLFKSRDINYIVQLDFLIKNHFEINIQNEVNWLRLLTTISNLCFMIFWLLFGVYKVFFF